MIHLHVHSEGSVVDGLSTVGRLVQHAASMQFPALALTEHGNLSTAVAFQVQCLSAGIKPIFGMEAYLSVDGVTGHITLLSHGRKGWSNLVALNNIGQRSTGRRPVVPLESLLSHADGLVCLTGCAASPLQRMPLGDALQLGRTLKGAFGGRLFAEVMLFPDGEEGVERSIALSESLSIPLVVTNDAHFPKASDADAHSILLQIKNKSAFYDGRHLWLKTAQELEEAAKGLLSAERLQGAIAQAESIARRIVAPSLKGEPALPDFHGMSDDAIMKLIARKAAERAQALGLGDEYLERAKYELAIIREMGFGKYFAILLDIINEAKALGARLGAGRGSGVGSLILYLLGITQIDPIEYGLSFERFLNPERQDFPDVDVDLDGGTRDALLECVADKWQGVQVATYSRFHHKSLVNDLARTLSLPPQLAKQVAEEGAETAAFSQLCQERPDFDTAYHAMLGQIRHLGKHAGGVVLLPESDSIPLIRVGDKLVAAWTEGGSDRELAYVGMVKYDLLGVTTLDALKEMEKRSGVLAPTIADDEAVFNLFCRGDLTGISHFSGSDGIRKLTVDVQPHTLEDLAAINALYRPGPLGAGTAQKFVEWRKKPRLLHPDIDAILAPTAGVITYQEQVMAIFKAATGGTMAQADNARKLFSKPQIGNQSWESKIEVLKGQFFSAAVNRWGDKLTETLWEELVTHSRYSFNKSHSVAYSFNAYAMAHFKLYHPLSFYVAMLNHDSDKAKLYLLEAAKRGILIKPPHINVSTATYENDADAIYMPLTAARFVGDTAVQAIVNERELNGPFTSMSDIATRVEKRKVNKRVLVTLYRIGALEGLDGDIDDILPRKEQGAVTRRKDRDEQREVLGYVIPSPDIVRQMKRWPVSGAVDFIEERTKGSNTYTVIGVMGEGRFWTPEPIKAEIGDYIGLHIQSGKGKVLQYGTIE